MGVFTRTGGTIGLFGTVSSGHAEAQKLIQAFRIYFLAGMAATFTYVDHTLANMKGKDDAINGAACVESSCGQEA
jgi:hypothetical protein